MRAVPVAFSILFGPVGLLLLLAGAASPADAGQADLPPAPAEQQSGVVWLESYDAGMKTAQDKQTPVLLFFTASWCPWCHKLEQEVFTQPQVLAELKKFVCVRLDTGKNHNVAMAYGVVSLPRVFVINTLGEIVGDWLGYRDANQLLELLADVQPYANEAAGTRKAPQVLPAAQRVDSNSPPAEAMPGDPAQLMEILGHKEPAIRQNAADALTKSGPAAMPILFDALKHEYLGVRIAAWKIIRTLGGADVDFDPWASSAERTQTAERLREPPGNESPRSAEAESRSP